VCRRRSFTTERGRPGTELCRPTVTIGGKELWLDVVQNVEAIGDPEIIAAQANHNWPQITATPIPPPTSSAWPSGSQRHRRKGS